PLTVVLVPGAFHTKAHWLPFGKILEAAGHSVVYPELPAQDPNGSFEDDTEAVKKAITGLSNILIMFHSRGTETARLLASEDLERFVGAIILSSGGPHAYQLDPSFPEADMPRYTDEYQSIISQKPNNMTGIDKERAGFFLYHDVEDEAIKQQAVDDLQDQRNSTTDTSPVYTLPTQDLAIEVWLGIRDRILTTPRAVRVWKEFANITPEPLPSGHTPQLSIINYLFRRTIHFANQARKTK
ncbi:MAG TPA: alpha/beta hydrolase, partial [Candidatus Saccharimonadales bacterium]|nr:alpha/beta hydrolase [Candidatus Saccharimonadales bacterium]